jgi:ABC-type glycerol-3-phosphate transport system substrate-binding protein
MFEDLLIGHGGQYFSPDGLVSRLDTPPALAAMKLYSDMMHVHKVLPTPAEAVAMSSQGGWGSGAITWFSNQQAAMIFIGRWYLCQAPQYPGLRKDPADPHSDLKLRCIRLPAVAGRVSSGECDARGNGINITSPLREDATKFLHYLASREYGMVIVHDGDSLPPNPALARTGRDLCNDFARDPNFHQPFIDAVPPAHPPDMSPFIDGMLVGRWLDEALSKVENRLASPEQVMRAMAAEINQRIRRNLERRTDLQRHFEKITGHKWTPDWRYEADKAK